jgi:hypothetical protein
MKPVLSSLAFASLALSGLASGQSRPVFLTPTQMPVPINLPGSSSYSMALSADGLQAMVETDRPGGRGGRDLVLLQRATTSSSFTSYGPMGFCGAYDEGGGVWSDDWLLFSSTRPGGAGGHDLYSVVRGALSPWTTLNSPWDDTEPSLTSDGLEFFFTSTRPGSLGGRSIWRSTRASVNDAWGSPVPLSSIDSANHEQSASLTDDGLWLFFSSNRGGNFDIYAASRSSRLALFGAPVRVAELSGPNHDIGIKLASMDGSSKDAAYVTVMISGRAVILSAEQRATEMLAGGAALSVSDRVAVGDVLSATLRSPAGHYGLVLLGAPMDPVQLPIGVLEVDPRLMLLLGEGVQGEEGVRLVQMLVPGDPLLRGLPIAIQALDGQLPNLALTNAELLIVQ